MIRTLQLDKQWVQYDLTYKNIKNINLRIKSDGSIMVSAPEHISCDKIDQFMTAKSNYIINSLNKFKEIPIYKPKEKRYISGESFKYLGNDLRLKLILQDKNEVHSDGIYIYLGVKDKDNYSKKKSLVENWIRYQTMKIYTEIAYDVYKKFIKYGIDFPIIKIRKMKKRWGSCQPQTKTITINSQLIEAPRFCIEYVMMHEFCHFIHPNHSKDFYTLLQVMMPDWKERKKMLEVKVFPYI